MSGQIASAVARTGNNPFLKSVAAISTVAGWVAATMIVVAVAITCQMIFIRFVMNGSTVWQTEVVVYLVIAATLVGLPYVQRLRGHVNVDLLPLYLSHRWRLRLALLASLVALGFCLLVLWNGIEWWWEAYDGGWTTDSMWRARLWIYYAALPIGMGVLCLQYVADIYCLLTGRDMPFGMDPEQRL